MLEAKPQDLTTKIKQIVSEQLAHDPNSIDVRQHIKAELGADSLDAIELMMAIEDEFAIEIEDEEAEAVSTVADLITLVERKTAGSDVEEIQPIELPDPEPEQVSEVRQSIIDRGDFLILDQPHFDQAIIGVAERPNLEAVVYDSRRVIQALVDHEGMDHEDAQEWFDFNIAGAFAGDNAPLFLDRLEQDHSSTIDRLCSLLSTTPDKVVESVERLITGAHIVGMDLREDDQMVTSQSAEFLEWLDEIAGAEPGLKTPTDIAVQRMAADAAAWLDGLIRQGVSLVLGRDDWDPQELGDRLTCAKQASRTIYSLDGIQFLETYDVEVKPDDLGGSDGHTLRYSMDYRFLVGGTVDHKPVAKDEPGLYLDSGEFVPAAELKGWHGGAL